MWTFNKLYHEYFWLPKRNNFRNWRNQSYLFFKKEKYGIGIFSFFDRFGFHGDSDDVFYNTMGKIRKRIWSVGNHQKTRSNWHRAAVNNNRSCGSTAFPRLKPSIRIPDGLASSLPSVHHLIQETFSFFFKCLVGYAFYLLDFFDWWYEIDKRRKKNVITCGINNSTWTLPKSKKSKKKQAENLLFFLPTKKANNTPNASDRWRRPFFYVCCAAHPCERRVKTYRLQFSFFLLS